MSEITDTLRKHDYYRYLCCLLAPSAMQENMLNIYAFNNELAKIKYVISEPMAGYIRLQWWRDAIDEIYERAPVKHFHPVSNGLHKLLSTTPINKDIFENLIDAHESDIEFESPEDMESLENYAIGTSANLFKLQLLAAGIDNSAALNAAHHGAIAYGLADIMRNMRYNASHNMVMLPKSLMDAQNITIDNIIEGANLERAKPIVKILCDKADGHLAKMRTLRGNIPKSAMPALLPIAIAPAIIKLIRKHDYDLFSLNFEAVRFRLQMRIMAAKILGRL